MQPSFAYLYDGALAQGGIPKGLTRIENEVARLGVQGPVIRDGFHDVTSSLSELSSRGIKNLIFVGTDLWFLRWIPWMANHGHMIIGYLPIEPSLLAKAFGIPVGGNAVEVIAARVIRALDLGVANARPFLTEAIALKTAAKLELEGSYAVSARTPSPLSIQNFALQPKTGKVISSGQDGQLEAILQTPVEKKTLLGLWTRTEVEETRIAFTRAKVRDDREPVEFVVDGQMVKAKEVQFDVLPKAVSFIVGPERLF